MPHLQRLPDELLFFIIHNLSSSKDVAALSIQFRRIHQVCAPDLAKRRRYRRIRIRKDDHLNPAFEILLSILRKPYLGTYVRHLEIDRQPVHSSAYRKVENADCLRSLSASDLDLVKKAVGRLPSLRYDDDVFLTKDVLFNMVMQRKIDISPPGHRSSFYANNTDRAVFIGQAIAVLLMSVCPGLESLVLGAPFIVDDGIVNPSQHHLGYRTVAFPLDRFLNSVTSSDGESAESHWGLEPGGPYLQEVRNIEFLPRPYLSSKWYSPCDIRSCLDVTQDLPNLQAISVDGMKDFDESYFRYHLGRNNIQNVRLHRSLVGTGVLVRLICAPRKLREFTYTSGYVDYMPLSELGGKYGLVGRRAHESEDPYTFNTPWFIGGILNHKKTLETLELDCDYQFQKDGSSRPVSHWLQSPPWSLGNQGSLKDFTALTCLDVGVEMFFILVKGTGSGSKSESSDLIDELPPKLRSLTIRGYEKGMDPERDHQLENLEHSVNTGLYPRLKEVRGIRERIPAGTYALRETWLGGEDPDFTLDDWTDYDE